MGSSPKESLPKSGHLTLQFPFKHGAGMVTELSFRRTKMRDELNKIKRKRDQSLSDEEVEILMFADICEVDPDVINELDTVDYQSLQVKYTDFFPKKTEPV